MTASLAGPVGAGNGTPHADVSSRAGRNWSTPLRWLFYRGPGIEVPELGAHLRGVMVPQFGEDGQRVLQADACGRGIAFHLAGSGEMSQDFGLAVLVTEFAEYAQ